MTAIELIAAERARQIAVEGWTPEHDDEHDSDDLSLAAACYATPAPARTLWPPWFNLGPTPKMWPWERMTWKPTPKDRIRELVKAGALIVAEIERLQRKGGAS